MELRTIIARCKQGDSDAFGILYCSYYEKLKAVCLHYVPNESVADDLLHDAFVLIFSRIGNLKDDEKADAWMKTVMRNVALLYLRNRKQHNDVPLSEISETAAPEPSPVSYEEIMTLVNALPKGYRQVFRLSALEGMSHQEIAELLHIEPHSSSSQLYRAKLMLRRWLRTMVLLLMGIGLPLGWYLARRPTNRTIENPVIHVTNQTTGHTVRQHIAEVSTSRVQPICPALPLTDSIGKLPDSMILVPACYEECISEVSEDKAKVEKTENKTHGDSIVRIVQPERIQGQMIAGTTRQQTGTKETAWTIGLAYSGMNNSGDMSLPDADIYTNDVAFDSVSHHDMPVMVALSLNRSIGSQWQLGTGVRYMRLTSNMQSGNTFACLHQHQRVQYLAFPVTMTWGCWLNSHWYVYATGGVALNVPLRSTLESVYMLNGKNVESEIKRLYPGLQWSVGMGVGAEYRITPHVGFFVQPGLLHYFPNDSGVETWNTEHPFVLSVPVGMRIVF